MPTVDPSPLSTFSPATRAWFTARFPASTAVQDAAWTAIARGEHTLVIAPTGSGKTLAAFLHAIDQLFAQREQEHRQAPEAKPVHRTGVLYISPIKALGADVQRNLQLPLEGITTARARRGDAPVTLSVGLRTGDTAASERARLLRRPPDILITTPESLFLMLTSKARETLRGVHTVIIDEIHAVAGGKRGSHLALSLERLEVLLHAPAQRIGLSATVRPEQQVAEFLAGDRPVTIVNPPATRGLDVRIVVPVEDMADLPSRGVPGERGGGSRAGSLWPHVEASILDEVLQCRSTIVFANSRGVAEKLTARLNEQYAERFAATAPRTEEAPATLGSFTGSTVNHVLPPAVLIARSHHGSVSKEQRADIEQALKSGALRCVVATSSLELGIDMGLVDRVIQVAAPPSVASALQRVGRAGHQVGGISSGRIYPRTRRDLIDAAVAVEGMLAGRIEAIDAPRNPLDVLAQHTVAAVAMDTLDVEAWFACVRRAAPYRTLPRSAFDATLDMLAGRYPSDDFAGFRPRLVWNRQTGELTARPGAKQLAVTSGGTIPDRGMFSVMLPEGEERAGSRRVGELDEEMVHESRVNDVITLGATSWRIDQITHDQVVVTPAPGRSARLPFWRGEGAGRPAELGAGIGAFLATLEACAQETDQAVQRHLEALGLEANAIANILALVNEQREATGVLPTDTRLLVERCRDELGDWRIMLHSPYGRRVHDPWALAVAERLRERWGIDPAVVASDDGIVARIPETTGRVPGAELFLFEPERLRRLITEAVGGTALFAARFRECASRALLLPRRAPGRRSPLWQQRLRAGQLLQVARTWPEFPILIETARECLQDVYDLDALGGLMQRLTEGAVDMVEVTTEAPSPFAANLLFGYVAEFMYDGDAPLAERRASVLALDSALLGDLLGQVDAAELLDAAVVAQVHAELQRTAPGRKAKGREGIADLLRELGPLTGQALTARLEPDTVPVEALLAELRQAQRVLAVDLAGQPHWAAVEDAARLRDALGAPLPRSLPGAFRTPVADPLGDLLARFARTRGPFTTADAATAFGLGVSVADAALSQLATQGKLLRGHFGAQRLGRDGEDPAPTDHAPLAIHEWVSDAVFQRLRLRSLQAARAATRPVPAAAYTALLLEHHGLLADARHAAGAAQRTQQGALEGTDGVLRVVEQLAGVPLPLSVWESQILPARVADYSPALLDSLLATGTVVWAGHARLGEDDGLVSLHLQSDAGATLPTPLLAPEGLSPLQQAILAVLSGGGAWFARQLAVQVAAVQAPQDGSEDFGTALWGLAWAGHVTSDIGAPLRALSGARQQQRQRSMAGLRRRRGFAFMPAADPSQDASPAAAAATLRADSPTLAGRWSVLPRTSVSDTVRALALTEGLLDRHGVVTRAAVMNEAVPGGLPALLPVLRRMEDAGRVLRGRFVEGLGGAQFAERTSVDRLRELAEAAATATALQAVALSVLDPACPFGTVVPWPALHCVQRPVRRAGALVAIVQGRAVLYLPQGGRHLLAFLDTETAEAAPLLAAAAGALALALRRGRRLSFTLELCNDLPIGRSALSGALRAAGFSSAPKGLDWHG